MKILEHKEGAAPQNEHEAILAAIACLAESASFDRLKQGEGDALIEDETMTTIYRIAHAFTACPGIHDDWKKEGIELAKYMGVPFDFGE